MSACAVVLAAAAVGGSASAETRPPPVPSLAPAATQAEWQQLVDRPQLRASAADCAPLRAVFYAATDWLRLATSLAANASPCAQYLVSVPPLTADRVAVWFANGNPKRRDVTVAPKFEAGQRVRARNINPPTHTRLPRYARGKVGIIERDHARRITDGMRAGGTGGDNRMVWTLEAMLD